MQSMLASHSQVAYLPETAFIRRYVAGDALPTSTQGDDDTIAAALAADTQFQRTGLDAAVVVARARKDADVTGVGLYKAMLGEFADARAQPHVGDKDPRLIEYIDVVFALYPDAQIVQMIRDPRDTMLSRQKADWAKGAGRLKHVFVMRVQNHLAKRHTAKRAAKNFHRVKYEHLLGEPEAVIKDLCEALGLSYEAEMLAFSAQAEQLVSKEEYAWKKETTGPLLTENKNKWMKEMDDWDVALVEAACGDTISEFDYDHSNAFSRLSLVQKCMIWGLRPIIAILDYAYVLYRERSVRRVVKSILER